ncbi:putative nuclear pore complex subunit protein [Botrytis fragariae]|uniref:Putative nuclear pore complex subunit protein n=1 Tax=Botrytis fragariae TaxID=1964551 RepID=A0A8H6ANP2_9HELO|nr:putative nuclear pore complex subunit protein [Botrytis fragariae]KAF5870774.1 putative nuclear pore complex subunit protein [Botrytis fragariae]
MSPSREATPPPQEGFALLTSTHRDIVEASAFNTYGTRFATGSADGKIKVYNRHHDGSWVQCDTWGAHNGGEVLQLQWLPPTIHPNLIASIGTDGRFKLWVEDPTLAPNKGRRFNSHNNRPVWETRSHTRAPFLSFSIKHHAENRHTYIALVDRDAQLIIYENEEPENMTAWTELDRVNVCEKPARGEEVSFKVAFDPNLEPCYRAIREGVPRDALGLVVASMNKASIWRTKEISHTVSLGSASTKELYLAAELRGHRGLVRDVTWAAGNIRGWDEVATACKDGVVRVFRVVAGREGEGLEGRSSDFEKVPEKIVTRNSVQMTNENGAKPAPSGISAGLAGQKTNRSRQQEAQGRDGAVIHAVKEISRLEADRAPVWKVEFDADGQLLGSTGDDGKLMMWRREPTGLWSRSAELAMNRA